MVVLVWCAVLVGLTWADTLEVPTISPHCRAPGAVAGTKQRRWRGERALTIVGPVHHTHSVKQTCTTCTGFGWHHCRTFLSSLVCFNLVVAVIVTGDK